MGDDDGRHSALNPPTVSPITLSLAIPQMLRFHRELTSRNLLPANAEPSRNFEELMRLVDGNIAVIHGADATTSLQTFS